MKEKRNSKEKMQTQKPRPGTPAATERGDAGYSHRLLGTQQSGDLCSFAA